VPTCLAGAVVKNHGPRHSAVFVFRVFAGESFASTVRPGWRVLNSTLLVRTPLCSAFLGLPGRTR
jgi:hypothetical protein